MKHGLESWACASLCTCVCLYTRCSARDCVYAYVRTCIPVSVCMCVALRGVAHRCKEIGSLPQESRLPPLPAPTPCSGRGPSSIKRAGSPECPCCSIPTCPRCFPGLFQKEGAKSIRGLQPPNCTGAGTGVKAGGWVLGGFSPLPRGTGVQGCALLPTEPLLGTDPLRGS